MVATAARYVPGRLIADLKIARGLDYYTGTVYETELVGYESWGSISSGGRYDSLASDGRTTYPGVGLSIGVTRLLAPLFARGLLTGVPPGADGGAGRGRLRRRPATRRSPSPSSSGPAASPARWRRTADKFGKQIRYADRRGIPYVWFGGLADGEVKDLRSGRAGSGHAGRLDAARGR